jgi:hypothetical protein
MNIIGHPNALILITRSNHKNIEDARTWESRATLALIN